MVSTSFNFPKLQAFATQRTRLLTNPNRTATEIKEAFDTEKQVIKNISTELLPKIIEVYAAHFDQLVKSQALPKNPRNEFKVPTTIEIDGKPFNLYVKCQNPANQLPPGSSYEQYWQMDLRFTLNNEQQSIRINTSGNFRDGKLGQDSRMQDGDQVLAYNSFNPASVGQSGNEPLELLSLRRISDLNRSTWLSNQNHAISRDEVLYRDPVTREYDHSAIAAALAN